MQKQWKSEVLDRVMARDFHRIVRDESDIELKLIQFGLTRDQIENVIELMYDYAEIRVER